MPRQSMPWCRLYGETLRDRKIRRVARISGQSRMIVNGAWMGLLCLASDSPERGRLLISDGMPLTFDEIAEDLGCDDDDVLRAIFDAMEEAGMIIWEDDVLCLPNWNGRQRASDSSAARTRAYRERKQHVTTPSQELDSDVSETSQTRHSDVIDSDTELDTDSDSETEKIIPAQPPPRKRPKRAATPRAARDPSQGLSIAAKEFFAQFRRKRWTTPAQGKLFAECEQEVGSKIMLQAVKWAAEVPTSKVHSIVTTAHKIARGDPRDNGRNRNARNAGILTEDSDMSAYDELEREKAASARRDA